MQESVLNLGEQIVLAARLAAIEHVRQEMEEGARRSQRLGLVGDEPVSLCSFTRQRWQEFFRRADQEAA
ncbi:MAG: hypothetical protein H7144_04370 [Burkholderiales bacterium]|nr:hypothetical protein [Phycisphaerae bacterium]